MNTYKMYLFQFFFFIKLGQFCFCFVSIVYGVLIYVGEKVI